MNYRIPINRNYKNSCLHKYWIRADTPLFRNRRENVECKQMMFRYRWPDLSLKASYLLPANHTGNIFHFLPAPSCIHV